MDEKFRKILREIFENPPLREAIRRGKEEGDRFRSDREYPGVLTKCLGVPVKTKIVSDEVDEKSEVPKIEIIETLITLNVS
ncbi:MAG: hypothetical protein UT05_C0004G0036 [Parcubacteria group bacterium GW2011_GWF2_38_76]|nr:MAG: hypothetical protein UT05_C0004G0036 [Parcubacteria group bacterium GW2011_GWF2_38_76]HBM45659.1 hypothetical protein [Patescibacteria group bacterium]